MSGMQCRVFDTVGGEGFGPVNTGTAGATGGVRSFVTAPSQMIGGLQAQALCYDICFMHMHERRFHGNLIIRADTDGVGHAPVE